MFDFVFFMSHSLHPKTRCTMLLRTNISQIELGGKVQNKEISEAQIISEL